MSETKSASVAAYAMALSAFSLAVVGAWALAGAPIPSPEALPAVASPLTAMLLLLTREGFPAVAAAIAWLLAFDVALAVVIVALLVGRARRSPEASRLALAIALLAAGFTTLFFLQSLSPFDAWAAVLNERASRAIAIGGRMLGVAILTSAGVVLVSLGLWVLFRFWMAYPVAVDAEAVGEFASARAASVVLRTNPVSRLFGTPPRFAVEQSSRSIATWFGPDFSEHPLRNSLGKWFREWVVASVIVWAATSLAVTAVAAQASRPMSLVLPLAAIFGVMPLAWLILPPWRESPMSWPINSSPQASRTVAASNGCMPQASLHALQRTVCGSQSSWRRLHGSSSRPSSWSGSGHRSRMRLT